MEAVAMAAARARKCCWSKKGDNGPDDKLCNACNVANREYRACAAADSLQALYLNIFYMIIFLIHHLKRFQDEVINHLLIQSVCHYKWVEVL